MAGHTGHKKDKTINCVFGVLLTSVFKFWKCFAEPQFVWNHEQFGAQHFKCKPKASNIPQYYFHLNCLATHLQTWNNSTEVLLHSGNSCWVTDHHLKGISCPSVQREFFKLAFTCCLCNTHGCAQKPWAFKNSPYTHLTNNQKNNTRIYTYYISHIVQSHIQSL